MDEEGKFWAVIWALVSACLVTIVVALYAYNVQRDDKLSQMVKSGADPIYAACSLGALRDQTCNLYTASDRKR